MSPYWLGSAPGQAPANKGRTFPAEPLTRAEVEGLLAQCSPRSSTGLRNRALLTVLWRSGLRITETLELKPSDVDYTGGTVRVLRGKGRKARTVGLDAGGLAVVQRWHDRRRELGLRGGYLLCTLAGGRLNDRYVRILLARLAERAGIEKTGDAAPVAPLVRRRARDRGRAGQPHLGLAGPRELRCHQPLPGPHPTARVVEVAKRRIWTEPGVRGA
jgi:site-specific recombinase XerC